MTREEILKKAVYIQFPLQRSILHKNLIPNTYKDYGVDGVVKLPLPNGMLYLNWLDNEHHYTTEYHKKYVIPVLINILNIKYNEKDFTWPKRVSGNHDITIPVPNKDYNFNTLCFTKNISENLDYNGLTHGLSGNTDYHKLFRYPHMCSKIVNENIDTEYKLLISGDSQLIPDVGFLCCFYKEVWYLDNRSGGVKMSNYLKDAYFDDVLVQLNAQDGSFYLEKPFI